MVAVAGPLINILIMLVGVIIKNSIITYSNLIISLFNLIPIYPLDGGRIMKGIFNIFKGNFKTEKIINRVSNCLLIISTVISSFLIVYIKNFTIIFILIYLWIIVIKENKRYRLKKRIYNLCKKTGS